jgi:hypothetical protein
MRARLRQPEPEEVEALKERSRESRPTLNAYIDQIAQGQGDPYSLAFDLYRAAMSSVAPEGRDGAQAYGLYMLFGALTDWVENKPAERPEAEAAMQRAAKDWIAVRDADEPEWRAYFDRWLYDEMGYKRGGRARVAARGIGDVTPSAPPEGDGPERSADS